jgi:hypothetical protein
LRCVALLLLCFLFLILLPLPAAHGGSAPGVQPPCKNMAAKHDPKILCIVSVSAGITSQKKSRHH